VGACYLHAATVDYHSTLVCCSHKSFVAHVVNNLQAYFKVIAKQAYLLDINYMGACNLHAATATNLVTAVAYSHEKFQNSLQWPML
jgi:hypothetical protein